MRSRKETVQGIFIEWTMAIIMTITNILGDLESCDPQWLSSIVDKLGAPNDDIHDKI